MIADDDFLTNSLPVLRERYDKILHRLPDLHEKLVEIQKQYKVTDQRYVDETKKYQELGAFTRKVELQIRAGIEAELAKQRIPRN